MEVVDFTSLMQVCHRVASSLLASSSFIKFLQFKTWSNLIFVGFLWGVKTTYMKLVDKMSWQSTCIKRVDNLQPTWYHQPRASDANVSWYWLDDCDKPAADLLELVCSWLCMGQSQPTFSVKNNSRAKFMILYGCFQIFFLYLSFWIFFLSFLVVGLLVL